MRPLFRDLFSFKKKEVSSLFVRACRKGAIRGLLLLQDGLSSHAEEKNVSVPTFGRLLIVVPRKVGNAVVRNRLRRQIKAIFWEHELYQKPCDSILLVYQQATNLSFSELSDFLKKFL